MLYSKTKIGDELEKAATEWGKMMTESLDARFGKGKTGFMLLLTTAGPGGSFHMNTNLKRAGLGPMLMELANRLIGRIIH